MSGKKILVVIDVQNCFLPGGNLATGGDDPVNFTNAINDLIEEGGFADVYLSQDMHHPNNISMANTQNIGKLESEGKIITIPGGLKLHTSMYNVSKMVGNRRWKKDDELVAQVLWPRHCIVPPNDPFYPGMPSNPSNSVKNMRVTKTTPVINTVNGVPGSDLAGVLNNYKKGKPEGLNSTVYHVYKGFSPDRDSYSAIADAYGNFDPFIAKTDGIPTSNMNTKFARKLLDEDNVSDIYICGIARDFCVYWTAMDLLDLVVFGKKQQLANKPTIHYIYDLTREVVPNGMPPEKLVEEATKFLSTVGVTADKVSEYFVVEDSSGKNLVPYSTMSGGRRTKVKHTKRNCKCGKTHKKCKCGKLSKPHKKTRKCL
jgi:nicotinamidase-related amidase